MLLKGKRALVTGAGTDGIGAASCRALAAEGAAVAIHHLDHHTAAEALAAEIRSAGGTASTHKADLGDPAAARALVHAGEDKVGPLDVVVACAATLKRVPFLDITDDEWARVHGVNLAGTFALCQEAARGMVARGSGRIIMISSVNQEHPTPQLAHYAASKGGVKMLARAMALELAPHGVTVNLVAPGTVETDINRAALANPEFRASKETLIPMNRIAAPRDIAGAVVYLAGPHAAYVTGTTITVDGGLTL